VPGPHPCVSGKWNRSAEERLYLLRIELVDLVAHDFLLCTEFLADLERTVQDPNRLIRSKLLNPFFALTIR
jgi:hypothetical protein